MMVNSLWALIMGKVAIDGLMEIFTKVAFCKDKNMDLVFGNNLENYTLDNLTKIRDMVGD